MDRSHDLGRVDDLAGTRRWIREVDGGTLVRCGKPASPSEDLQRPVAPGSSEELHRMLDTPPLAAVPEPDEDVLGNILGVWSAAKNLRGRGLDDIPETAYQFREFGVRLTGQRTPP